MGDSSVDCGTNIFFGASAHADRPLHGRDFDTHQPTHRFCNGRFFPPTIPFPLDQSATRLFVIGDSSVDCGTNAEGQRTTPSVVVYTKAGDRLVGEIAKRQAVVNLEHVFLGEEVCDREFFCQLRTNAEGQRTTPSVVANTKAGDRLVGQIVKRQTVVNPENTFFSVKRFIGRKMNEVDEESKQVLYRVVKDEIGNVKLECPATGKLFAPEEISA